MYPRYDYCSNKAVLWCHLLTITSRKKMRKRFMEKGGEESDEINCLNFNRRQVGRVYYPCIIHLF